jgi:sterol desaturase/sphingolipid hydroxylase (fatty acid hydroxylase superfamily)
MSRKVNDNQPQMFIQIYEQLLPAALIVLSTSIFFTLERFAPGRELPHSSGWYRRAVVINLVQLALIGLGGLTWNRYFRDHALLQWGTWSNPVVEGFIYWIAGTFVFYWWHRLRHANGFWLAFHQIHHSPSRIEVLTSFYKHPIEIAADSMLAGFLIYCVFGGSALAGAWTSFFGATGEYFYHSNIRTPVWLGYFIQRPEHHSIHHQLGVHRYNFGDITWWDRLFGTFKEAEAFAPQCGFPGRNEERLKEMLCFKDVYQEVPGGNTLISE